MSWVSKKTGIHLGNIGAPIGAAIGSFIPGVGTAIGAGLGQGIGALGQKKPIGKAVQEGFGAYGTAKSLGGLRKGTAGNPTFPTGGPRPLNFPNWVDPTPHPTSTSGNSGGGGNWWDPIVSGIGNAAKGAVNYAKDNPLNVAMGGLAAAQALAAAKASARQGRLSDEAIGLAKGRWAGGAPLRAAGQAGLLKPRPATDFNSIFADPTNPFAAKPRALSPASPSGTAPLPAGPTAAPMFPPNRLPTAAAPRKRLIAPPQRKLLPRTPARVAY